MLSQPESGDTQPGFFRRIGNLKNQKRITLNKRLLIFSFFLLLSIIFWLITALSKNYNSTLLYPVRYIKLPEGKVLVNDVPDKLELSVNARGYTLLNNKLKSRLIPIVFNVQSFSLNRIPEDPTTVFILTNYVKERIANQMSQDIRILDISPDSLIFRFADVVSKKIGVHSRLTIEFEKQYMQVGEITIEPDSITVSGPQSIIDTLSNVYTRHQLKSGVSQTLEFSIPIKPIDKVEYSDKKVNVVIPVEKFTEANLEIPIEVINVPDSLVLRTFPTRISLMCQVGLSNYENITVHMFRAEVDYESISRKLGDKIPVTLVKYPEYIQSINYHPKNVDYIIER